MRVRVGFACAGVSFPDRLYRMSPRDPMVMSSRFLLLLLLSSTAIGCGDHPVEVVTTGGPPPTVVSPNVVVSTTLGVPVTYDASKGGAVFAAAVSGALR